MKKIPWLYRLVDVISFWIAVLTAYHLRFSADLIPIFTSIPDLNTYIKAMLLLTPFYVAVMEALGNYNERLGKLSEYEVQNLYRSLLIFYVGVITVSFFVKYYNLSRLTLLLSYFFNFLYCLALRAPMHLWQQSRWRKGLDTDRILLVGVNKDLMEEIADAVERHPDKGYRIAAQANIQNGLHVDPGIEFDRILVAGGELQFNHIADLVLQLPAGMRVDLVPALHHFLTHLPTKEKIEGFPVIPVNRAHLPSWNSFLKRSVDISLSTVLIIIQAPLFLLISIALLLLYGRPVFFKQKRVGRNGHIFWMYKFRTMTVDAAQKMEAIVNEGTKANFKWKNDPRVLGKYARFLRRTSLDELPQLWNVLTGSMSLVGPRPAPTEFVRKYSAAHKLRFSVQPGLTGLQQIYCRGTESIEEILEYDVRYINEQSFFLDVMILLKTIPAVILGRGTH